MGFNMAGQKEIGVLIVEDNPVAIVNIRQRINSMDCFTVVGEATSGEHALELLVQLKPDVVLMDIGLPGMDGIQTTEKVKELMPKTAVIVVSVHDDEETVAAAISAGIDGYYTKRAGCVDDTLNLALRTVAFGGAWIEPDCARRTLELIMQREKDGQSRSAVMQPLDDRLTAEQKQVLKLLTDGMNDHEISESLDLDLNVVHIHLHTIMERMTSSEEVQIAVKRVLQTIW
jgi:DNA-binding NarL/FixJ family response regulator